MIAWFADVGIADRPTVGGKGGSLGELTQAGIAVPPGFVVTTAAFELFLAALEARAPVRDMVAVLDPDDLGAATELSENLRRRVIEEPMPAEVEQAIRAAHAEFSPNGEPVAVRSSATTEDAEDASFAGLQDTFLWVLGADQMVVKVRECWGSLYSVELMCYRRKQGLPEDGVAMAVVVQRMVEGAAAQPPLARRHPSVTGLRPAPPPRDKLGEDLIRPIPITPLPAPARPRPGSRTASASAAMAGAGP